MISGNVVLPLCQLSGQQDSLFGNIIIFIFCIAISFQDLLPLNIFILGQRSLEPEVCTWFVVRDSVPNFQQNWNRRHMIFFIEKYHKYWRNSKPCRRSWIKFRCETRLGKKVCTLWVPGAPFLSPFATLSWPDKIYHSTSQQITAMFVPKIFTTAFRSCHPDWV